MKSFKCDISLFTSITIFQTSGEVLNAKKLRFSTQLGEISILCFNKCFLDLTRKHLFKKSRRTLFFSRVYMEFSQTMSYIQLHNRYTSINMFIFLKILLGFWLVQYEFHHSSTKWWLNWWSLFSNKFCFQAIHIKVSLYYNYCF